MIRDILYPKEIKFTFYQDSIKFIGIMAILSLASIVATVTMELAEDVCISKIIDRSLNLTTIAIPAALPVAMSVGVVFAINRLKEKNIFCISPPRINIAGQIDNFVFDKTGTLTEEGLTVLGFRPTIRSGSLNPPKF